MSLPTWRLAAIALLIIQAITLTELKLTERQRDRSIQQNSECLDLAQHDECLLEAIAKHTPMDCPEKRRQP